MRTYFAALTRQGKHTHAAVTARLLTDPAITEPDLHLLPEGAYADGETVRLPAEGDYADGETVLIDRHQILAALTR